MELKKNQTNLKGNDRYQGFGFDMIKVLAERLMFKYQIVISKETSYGAPIGGEWKGLVGELINQVSSMQTDGQASKQTDRHPDGRTDR